MSRFQLSIVVVVFEAALEIVIPVDKDVVIAAVVVAVAIEVVVTFVTLVVYP